ncbi:MAG TPA: hypothetical protein VHP14_15415 [Anaerolineales bacterium]|nr:hypothetical protein [Anaerolineales bacterium]
MKYYRSHVLVCADPECVKHGAYAVLDSLQDELVSQGLIDEVQVLETSRIGDCSEGPELMVYPEGVHYVGLTKDDMPYLVQEHFLKGRVAQKFVAQTAINKDEELRAPTEKEIRVVLRNCGLIDPENIEDYIAEDGYMALAKVLTEMTPEQVIDTVMKSGMRGRGGAGFPAAKKWKIARDVQDSPKYLTCNADEGDPGAFMNRRVLEGDPHSVIEGMVIAAYAIGASYGYVYCSVAMLIRSNGLSGSGDVVRNAFHACFQHFAYELDHIRFGQRDAVQLLLDRPIIEGEHSPIYFVVKDPVDRGVPDDQTQDTAG